MQQKKSKPTPRYQLNAFSPHGQFTGLQIGAKAETLLYLQRYMSKASSNLSISKGWVTFTRQGMTRSWSKPSSNTCHYEPQACYVLTAPIPATMNQLGLLRADHPTELKQAI
jgi:hypothetical protein